MTPEQIAEGAACYQCLNEDQKRAAVLYLLDQMASGGSGGTGLFVLKAGDTMTGQLVITPEGGSIPLKIGSSARNGSVDPQLLVSRNVDDSVAGNGHAFSDSSTITRGGAIGYNSFDGRVLISGTNNFNHYVPFQAAPTYSSSGTLGNLYGFFSAPTITAGTVTSNYGVYVAAAAVSGSGSIANDYGVYINGPSAGTSANYALYTAGSAISRFGGPVGIGGVNPTTAYPLYVYSDSSSTVNHLFRNANAGTAAHSFLQVQSAAGMVEVRAYAQGGTLSDTGVIKWTDLSAGLAFYNSTGSAEIIRFTDTMVTFSGITSASPGLKRSGTILQARLADDSAYAPTEASYARTATAYTVATLPAASTAGAGARAYVTDANATTFMSTVAGGGANVVPVFSDGTNWKIA